MAASERIMTYLFFVLLVLFVAYIINSKRTIKKEDFLKGGEHLPYRKRDELLSGAYKAFYEQICCYLGEKAVIFPKVSLISILYAGKRKNKGSERYEEKLRDKHVDFVVCDRYLNVLGGIYLDDNSEINMLKFSEESFLKRVFDCAHLPLIRIPMRSEYSADDFEAMEALFTPSVSLTMFQWEEHGIAPVCPKCGKEMVKREGKVGEPAEEQHYGCPNFPRCQETKEIVKRVPMNL